MEANIYQRLVARTECDQDKAAQRLFTRGNQIDLTRLNHAIIGISAEAGELAGQLQKAVYYGQSLDTINVKEELGDLLWYIAQACNTLGFDLAEVMAGNIRKLRVRYPEKYADVLAAEQNRDRGEEREALRPRTVAYNQELKARPNLTFGPIGNTVHFSIGPPQASKSVLSDIFRAAQEHRTIVYDECSSTPEAPQETYEGKSCEVCGKPATVSCHDSNRAFDKEEHHHFCKEHSRPTAILPG